MKTKVLISHLFVLMVLVCAAGCKASNQTGDLYVRFLKANTAYKAGDYDKALKIYQEISDAGYVSAAVYYNAGNCLMKKNELGAALVWYERALRLNPRDSDLKANWQYARSMMKNPEVNETHRWGDRLFAHVAYFADDEIIMVLCLVLSAISLLILAGLFWGWRFKKTLVLIVLLSGVFVFHVVAYFFKIETMANRAILLSSVDVKYEPEEGATTHFIGYEGWKVRVLKESSGWVKIERPDGLTGWVLRDQLQPI